MNSKDYVLGYATGYNDGLDNSSGNDDWVLPPNWPKVPEPSDYEICLLVAIDDESMNTYIYLGKPVTEEQGYGKLAVDWGDGTIESWEGYYEDEEGFFHFDWRSPISHTYTEKGLYVVKVATTEQNSLMQQACDNWLIAKLGSKITVMTTSYYAFRNSYRLQYVKLSGYDGLPRYCFYNCYALKKIDIENPPSIIPTFAFNNCRSLKSFDFSKVTEIQENGALAYAGFVNIDLPLCTAIPVGCLEHCYNLKSINATLCTSVGDSAFLSDYALETVEFAEGCTFGANCFSNCYSLYPYPNV